MTRRWPHGRWPPRPGLGPLAGIAAALSTLLQLMVSPILGLADNGDYKRILRPLGLGAVVPRERSPRFQYVWLHYAPAQRMGSSYRATEFELVRLTHRLSVILGFGPGLDLRLVGAVHAALLGLAVWLIVRALPGPLPLRALTALLLVIVLTDTRFTVYLNSLFTEPASLLALLFLVAALLHAWRRPTLSPGVLLAVTLAAAALILSKSQNAVLVIPIVIVLLLPRAEWSKLHLTGRWRGRIPGAACAALLIVLSAAYLRDQPADLEHDNRYNAVFVELLGHSTNPRRDLVDLGLSPELARYAGKPIYVPGNATHDPAFAGFFSKVTEFKLASFYLTHPGRALALAHRGATASMYLRPVGVSPPLGNQTLDSGAPPYYTACKLCLYSTISQQTRGASAILLPALWLAALAAALALLRRGARDPTGRPVAIVLLLLLSFAVISMAVALLGEGEFEIVKHLYLTSAIDALITVLTIHAAGLLACRARRSRTSRDTTEQPALPAHAAR